MAKRHASPRADTEGNTLDRLFSALSSSVRREILEQLRHGPFTAGELAAPHGLSLPAISRHLRVLEEAQLIHRRIDGRVHHLSLAPESLAEVAKWISFYQDFWSQSLDKLALHLESRAKR